MATTLARFTSMCVRLSKKAASDTHRPAVKKGDGGYADWLVIAVHGLKEHLGHPYRQLMDVLREMPRIVGRLELTGDELPHFTTICHAKERIYMPNWRGLLKASQSLHELGEIQAIDASGFDRIAASRKYAKRTNYTFQAMKTTLLVDCSTSTILDVHCSTKQPHDSQVGRQVIERNLDQLSILTGDKGYDATELRHLLRAHRIRPVIKHREFTPLDQAHNVCMNNAVYHQRSTVESAFRVLKLRFGDRLTARSWYGQFREMVLRCAVKNIEDHVNAEG